ncbi:MULTISPECIES: hypothetical protein [Muribaculaceae]|nr:MULTISPECIES: hypothetical protein [Muribaculaceae]
MTDTRFKWLSGCVTVAVIAIAAMIIYKPQGSMTAADDSSNLGEYIYIDEDNIVHTDSGCSRLNNKDMTFYRERLSEYVAEPDNRVCRECVSDEDFKKIEEANKRNYSGQ